jgi:hypothetical protein
LCRTLAGESANRSAFPRPHFATRVTERRETRHGAADSTTGNTRLSCSAINVPARKAATAARAAKSEVLSPAPTSKTRAFRAIDSISLRPAKIVRLNLAIGWIKRQDIPANGGSPASSCSQTFPRWIPMSAGGFAPLFRSRDEGHRGNLFPRRRKWLMHPSTRVATKNPERVGQHYGRQRESSSFVLPQFISTMSSGLHVSLKNASVGL